MRGVTRQVLVAILLSVTVAPTQQFAAGRLGPVRKAHSEGTTSAKGKLANVDNGAELQLRDKSGFPTPASAGFTPSPPRPSSPPRGTSIDSSVSVQFEEIGRQLNDVAANLSRNNRADLVKETSFATKPPPRVARVPTFVDGSLVSQNTFQTQSGNVVTTDDFHEKSIPNAQSGNVVTTDGFHEKSIPNAQNRIWRDVIGIPSAPDNRNHRRTERLLNGRPIPDFSATGVRVERSAALHQEVESNVRKMVIVAGTITTLFGVCLMAAIFLCCCRRKKRGGQSDERDSLKEETEKEIEKEIEKEAEDQNKPSRSKSPSPENDLGELDKDEKGVSEEDKLLEDDEDLGDFSVVARETDILRSYRKPPPPKNRARMSRAPRTMKPGDSLDNLDIFQELVEKEDREERGITGNDKPPKKNISKDSVADVKTSDESKPTASMLDDIDATIAHLNSKDISKAHLQASPSKESKDGNKSRDTSVEKETVPQNKESSVEKIKATSEAVNSKSSADNSKGSTQITEPLVERGKESSIEKADNSPEEKANQSAISMAKSTSAEKLQEQAVEKISESAIEKSKLPEGESPKMRTPKYLGKSHLTPSPSREEFAKSIAKELSQVGKKEDGSKPQSKFSSPKPSGKETSPKPQDKESASNAQHKESSPIPQNKERQIKETNKDNMVSKSRENVSEECKDGAKAATAPADKDEKEVQNVFALIDPTAGTGDKTKSKIPVRAGQTQTQPVPAVRHHAPKDKKQFMVPPVHGEQMDQVMKSLKTKLDSPSTKHLSSKVEADGEDETNETAKQDQSKSEKEKESREEKVQCKSEQTHL